MLPVTHAPETSATNLLYFLAPVFRPVSVWSENFWREK